MWNGLCHRRAVAAKGCGSGSGSGSGRNGGGGSGKLLLLLTLFVANCWFGNVTVLSRLPVILILVATTTTIHFSVSSEVPLKYHTM